MSKFKNKAETYSEIFTTEWELSANFFDDDDYDYWYHVFVYHDFCERSCCLPEYRIKETVYIKTIHKTNNILKKAKYLYGYFIDMNSIYKRGTTDYRNIMLMKILGDDLENKVTIGDFFNKNN